MLDYEFDEWETPGYVYEDPRDKGATRKTRRTWLHVIHHYRVPYSYQNETGNTVFMLRFEEAKHPNFIAKTLAIVLFPVSVLMTGFPEACRDTWRYTFDRRYGAFTSLEYFRNRKDPEPRGPVRR